MKFDSFTIGKVFETNSFKLTKEDIMRLEREYDLQYMHVDKKKATEGRFNGIIASGIHTLSISFKLWIEQGVYGDDIIAGRGMNNIKFIKPVYPGDKLHTMVVVIDTKEIKTAVGVITV